MKLEDFIKKHGNVSVNEKELKELLVIKDKKYFIPELGEEYWFVDFAGDVGYAVNNLDNIDAKIFENQEVFRTTEEAEEHAKKQRFLLQMKRDFLDNSDDIDWEYKGQTKWSIGYDHDIDKIDIDGMWKTQFNDFHTTNKEWLEEYIEKHEEDIKKYYFEIKEEK